jgi:hypothetical protein
LGDPSTKTGRHVPRHGVTASGSSTWARMSGRGDCHDRGVLVGRHPPARCHQRGVAQQCSTPRLRSPPTPRDDGTANFLDAPPLQESGNYSSFFKA